MFAYILLGVSPKNSDAEIKEAYMEKIKIYSPDRYPEEFKKIRKAYETIKTEKARLRYDILHKDDLEPADVCSLLLSRKFGVHLDANAFEKYFKDKS